MEPEHDRTGMERIAVVFMVVIVDVLATGLLLLFVRQQMGW